MGGAVLGWFFGVAAALLLPFCCPPPCPRSLSAIRQSVKDGKGKSGLFESGKRKNHPLRVKGGELQNSGANDLLPMPQKCGMDAAFLPRREGRSESAARALLPPARHDGGANGLLRGILSGLPLPAHEVGQFRDGLRF